MTKEEMFEIFKEETGLPEKLISEIHPVTKFKDAEGRVYNFNRWCLGVNIRGKRARECATFIFASDKFPKVGDVSEIPK